MENIIISYVDGKYIAKWNNHVSDYLKSTNNTITFNNGWTLEGKWNSYEREGYGSLYKFIKKDKYLKAKWYKTGIDPYYLMTIKGIVISRLYKHKIPTDLINIILKYFGHNIISEKNSKKYDRYKRKLWIRIMGKEFNQYNHLTKRQINGLYIRGF